MICSPCCTSPFWSTVVPAMFSKDNSHFDLSFYMSPLALVMHLRSVGSKCTFYFIFILFYFFFKILLKDIGDKLKYRRQENFKQTRFDWPAVKLESFCFVVICINQHRIASICWLFDILTFFSLNLDAFTIKK